MGAKRKQRPAMWVVRNPNDVVLLTTTKPLLLNSLSEYVVNFHGWAFCYRRFHRITGLTLKPGKLVRVRFSAEVVT